MAQIFISYARVDRTIAQSLASQLQAEGFSVWWDREIPVGAHFDEVIENEIAASNCVVVIWSLESVKSRWVRSEAAEGLRRGILIPVCIGDVLPPLEFRRLQTIKFQSDKQLRGEIDITELRKAITKREYSSATLPMDIESQSRLDGKFHVNESNRKVIELRFNGATNTVTFISEIGKEIIEVNGETVISRGNIGSFKRTYEFLLNFNGLECPAQIKAIFGLFGIKNFEVIVNGHHVLLGKT